MSCKPAGGVSNNLPEKKHSLLDCCGGLGNLDYSKMDLKVFDQVLKPINVHDPNFHIAVIAIIFNPLFWNLVARWEHRTQKLSEMFGSPYLACYFLGFVILLLNVYRSHSMAIVMKTQAKWELLDSNEVFHMGLLLVAVGSLLVVSSFLALGFTGTFLGDYFGIVMDEKVTGFPFSLTANPMYWGSTANYLGFALIGASPAGLVLTAIVALVYKIAIRFEGPFTEHLYRQRRRKRE